MSKKLDKRWQLLQSTFARIKQASEDGYIVMFDGWDTSREELVIDDTRQKAFFINEGGGSYMLVSNEEEGPEVCARDIKQEIRERVIITKKIKY